MTVAGALQRIRSRGGLAARAGLAGRRIGDGFVVVDSATDQVFDLNATAARVWELLAEGRDEADLLAQLEREYEVDRATLVAEVDEVVERLLDLGLLTTEPRVELGAPARPLERQVPAWERGWVLRWEAGMRRAPRLVWHGAAAEPGPSLWYPTMDEWALVDGALFEPTLPRAEWSRHVSERHRARGPSFLGDLRGPFTCTLWNRDEDAVLVARDAAGLRPVYYAWDGRLLLLSETLDALLAQPEVRRAVDRVRLAEHVADVCRPEQLTQTFYEGISSVAPAHWARFARSGTTSARYWDPLPPGCGWLSPAEQRELPGLLQQAVDRTIRAGADCIGLSGGYDSISIAALANGKRSDGQPLVALSVGMPGTESDEQVLQSSVARSLGMPQHWSRLGRDVLADDFLDRALPPSARCPGPMLSAWHVLYERLMDRARELGLRGLLLGTGGDEMFIVDPWYAADLLEAGDLRGLWRFVRAWQRTSPFSAAQVARVAAWSYGLKPVLRGLAPPAVRRALAAVRSVTRPPDPRWSVVAPDLRDALRARHAQAFDTSLAPGEGRYLQTIRALPQSPQLSLEMEHAFVWTKTFGLEGFFPFFDRDVMEHALRTPPEALYASGRMKAPLRELAARRLPGLSSTARKVDFTKPSHELMRAGSARTWGRHARLERLESLGVVSADAGRAVLEGYRAGDDARWIQAWSLLAAEAWLDARS